MTKKPVKSTAKAKPGSTRRKKSRGRRSSSSLPAPARVLLNTLLLLVLLFNPVTVRLMTLITAVGYGLDTDVFYRQIAAESSFRPFVQSGKGAVGPGQVQPVTAQYVCPRCPRAALWVPPANLAIAAAYTKYLSNKYYGNWSLVLAAYNWGETHVDTRLRDSLQSIEPAQDYRSLFTDIPETSNFLTRILN